MASSVVAALPSVASRLSIRRRLRVKASRFLKSSEFSTFLSSAALATIFRSIRKDSTLSFLVAGSICARLGPSSSSASATSLWRISDAVDLGEHRIVLGADRRPAAKSAARQPVTAREAKPKRRPVFVSGNEEVMQNPCLEDGERQRRRDTRPIVRAWQREKSVKMMNSLTYRRSVDNPPAQPYLCRNLSTVIELILLWFLPLNLGLPNSHSLGG